jgi:hypothetical protein
VLKAKVAPAGVPAVQVFLMRGKVYIGGTSDAGEGLGSFHGIGEGTKDREGGLTVISDGQGIAIF